MTEQAAKEILKANWWKNNNPSMKHEDYELFFGDVKETAADDKYFPNCFLIQTAVVKKGQQSKQGSGEKDGWGEMFVSKTDGKCGFAIIINRKT